MKKLRNEILYDKIIKMNDDNYKPCFICYKYIKFSNIKSEESTYIEHLIECSKNYNIPILIINHSFFDENKAKNWSY